ncbi:MAG: hypothetical protein ACT4PT_06565 [Methanobacteriota archaeon]
MPSTTLAVSDRTRDLLAELKVEWQVETYDELLRRMYRRVKRVPDSMYGADKALPPLTPKERRSMGGEDEHGHA